MELYQEKRILSYRGHIPSCSKVFVIADKKIASYSHIFKGFHILYLTASERDKSIATIEKVYRWLLSLNADRDCFIIGAGGGIITDISGFVASTYKRGVRFGFIPTTLLSQVDAAIGGKNGVNLEGFKNIVGVINEPMWSFCCTDFLKTLPYNEFKAGVAEVIKSQIVGGSKESYGECVEFFKQILHKPLRISNENMKHLSTIIEQSANIKLEICCKDLYDKSDRKKLNFGHTYGHAIEKLYYEEGKKISHGEAVGIGMRMAIELSIRSKRCSKDVGERIINDLKSLGLGKKVIDTKKIEKYLIQDKKVSSSNIDFIYLNEIGKVEIVREKSKNIF